MQGKINDLLLDIISSFGQSFSDDFRDYIFGDEPDIEYASGDTLEDYIRGKR